MTDPTKPKLPPLAEAIQKRKYLFDGGEYLVDISLRDAERIVAPYDALIASQAKEIERLQRELAAKPRMFPIQTQRGAKPHPLLIPWSIAELAYSVYAANYGTSQSLERLGQRGGFGPGEMDEYVPDWRDRCCEIERLKAENARLEADLDGFIHGSL